MAEYFDRYIPTELQTKYSEFFLKKKQFVDVKVFASNFTNGITEGFKPGSPYSDVTDSPSEVPTKSPTEVVCRWFNRIKLIYHHYVDPLTLYFSFFFPFPTLPSQIENNHSQKKKSPSFQHESYFFKLCDHNIRVLIYYRF